MAKIVDYNGHHVRIDSPLDKRLRKQDDQYKRAVDNDELEIIPDEDAPETAADGGADYSKLKKDELIALLDEREIDHSAATKNGERIALLEAFDAAAADGGTLE